MIAKYTLPRKCTANFSKRVARERHFLSQLIALNHISTAVAYAIIAEQPTPAGLFDWIASWRYDRSMLWVCNQRRVRWAW